MALFLTCSSPFRSSSSNDATTGLRLSFIITGRSSGATSSQGARLLLPTVKSLSVALTPIDSWLPTPDAQVVAVQGSSSVVSASFAKIQLGHYSITARAFDSSGTLAFRQTSTVNLSSATSSVTLNMVPVDVNATDLQLTTAQSYTGTLDAGTAKTWAIPSTAAISSSYGVQITADPAILIFIQDSTGVLLNADPSIRAVTAAQAAGSFLTLYNSGSSSLPVRFVLSAVNVVYDSNGATSGTVPTDLNLYAQGDSVTIAGAGSLVKTGSTFLGWNTAADGSGTSYSPGSTFTMGATGAVLYAQWSAGGIVVHFTLGSYQTLSFQEGTQLGTTLGTAINIIPSFSGGTNWTWVVDGVVDESQTGSTFVFLPEEPGFYTIYVTVTSNGVIYSGSLNVTVESLGT